MDSVFESAGGAEGLRRLASAWHARVLADPVVGHAFHEGPAPDHVERLAAYWGEALGGPPVYTHHYGSEADVERMHAGNGEHDEMNRRAIDCFDAALTDAGLAEPRLRQVLHDYFAWATAGPMYQRDRAGIADAAQLPRWSWGGLER